MIVGLNGFARSGKDEFAKIFVAFGFERIAFADVLRDIAYATDPFVRVGPRGFEDFVRLRGLVDAVGWDAAKAYDDVRRLLQRLGTEGGRDIMGKNIWVDTAFKRATKEDIVVTDVRFPNEADEIRLRRGGVVINITRPGIEAPNGHSSEHSMGDYPFDFYVENDGTIEELYGKAGDILMDLKDPR